MGDILQEVQNMCEAHGIQFTHRGNGHVQLKAHGCLLNYYPMSKRRTVFCGGVTTPNCTPYDAIKLCKQSGKTGLKPKNKHISKKPPNCTLGAINSEVLVRHLYTGDEPPWGHESRIMCYPDLLRIRAKKLLEEADNMENPEYYKDPEGI